MDDKHVHCKRGFVNADPRLLIESDVVCEVNTDCRDGGLLTETDKANLRLIAAAPELLAAVEWIRQYIAKHEDWIPTIESCPEAEYFDEVCTLIARVTGKNPKLP